MKICVIGLGSIGSRHVKNMTQVLNRRNVKFTIDSLRFRKEELKSDIQEYIDKVYYEVDELPDDYDVIFITNPTILHYDTIMEVVTKTKHMFIEKPVFGEKSRDVAALKLKPNGVYYVACPMRYSSVIKYVKKLVDEGEKIASVRAISSSYLPYWRKGTDYTKCYSARKELGGGVDLDLIHEWDYLTYLFGFPQKVYGISGKYSELEIDASDIAIYIAEYADKVVEVHLDYCGINSVRTLELIGDKRRIVGDFLTEQITIYTENNCELIKLEKEDDYINEMEHFFDLLEGKMENENTVVNAARVLELV